MVDKGKTRVLFVLNSFGTGGSERIVLDLCRGLDRCVYEPVVVSLYGGKLIGEFSKINVWNRCLDKKVGIDLTLMLRLSRIIREHEIDVVNAHHFSPFIHACLGSFLNHRPLLYTDHTINEIQKIPLYWRIMGTFLLKRCYGVIGISKGCSKQLQDTFHVPRHKTFTILNAIDMSRFEVNIDCQEKKKSLDICNDEKVIGCVGNLREQKNQADLLKAFKIIREHIPNTRLLLIGEGPMKEQLQSLSIKLGISNCVTFLGARLDAAELYQVMDVYCLSSHYEGLPLTILEAMASKLPVVGTDVVGINDVIVHGENGMLVKPNNPQGIAETIVFLLRNGKVAERLGYNSHQYVREQHNMVSWLKTYEALFSGTGAQTY